MWYELSSDWTWPGGIWVGAEVDGLGGFGDLRNPGSWAWVVTIGGVDRGIAKGGFSSQDGRGDVDNGG